MPTQYIQAWKQLQFKPNTECCDCGKEIEEAQENQVWTIWNGSLIYCPNRLVKTMHFSARLLVDSHT